MAIAPLRCDWVGSPLPHGQLWIRSQRNRVGNAFPRTVTAGLEEISQNHVLASAALAGLSAQLVKPLTSVVAGKGFNWKLMLKAGGTPSSHSATMVAAATALGLERGFTDSLFGFALVMAGIVMYDAQGVRREVGKHAEVLNTISLTELSKESPPPPVSRTKSVVGASTGALLERELGSGDENNGRFLRTPSFFRAAETLPSIKDGEVSIQEIEDENGLQHIPLKESIGHTKAQVVAGALFGISVSVISHAAGLS